MYVHNNALYEIINLNETGAAGKTLNNTYKVSPYITFCLYSK